jgi:hypothetical protein
MNPDLFRTRSALAAAAALLLVAGLARGAQAQTDYYNTDRGRPVQVEDASPTERYAFELKLAPVRLERARGGAYRWGLDPELAYGILPRTQIELGAPITYVDAAGTRRSGLAGLELSALHALNAESRTLPAFALRADLLAPVGGLAPDDVYGTFTAIATRTFRLLRVHANAQVTAGPTPIAPAASVAGEQSRWLAGVAADRTFPLRSVLVTGEVLASQPIDRDAPLEWTLGTGVRWQWTPTLALDGGIGRRLTGDERAWYLTFGSAYAFALAALLPGGAR